MTTRATFEQALECENLGELSQALAILEELGSHGHVDACSTLAEGYHDGRFGRIDPERSTFWIERLEDLADTRSEACMELYWAHRFSTINSASWHDADKWLQKAADAGNASAQHELSTYYSSGMYNYPRDPELAEFWKSKALDQEYPETLYICAMESFQDGMITLEAIELLQKAAAKGFAPAAHALHDYRH